MIINQKNWLQYQGITYGFTIPNYSHTCLFISCKPIEDKDVTLSVDLDQIPQPSYLPKNIKMYNI